MSYRPFVHLDTYQYRRVLGVRQHRLRQERNFGLKSGDTNSEGGAETPVRASQDERRGEFFIRK